MSEYQAKMSLGLLVVRRINYFKDSRFEVRHIDPAIALDHDEIVKRYAGIEGYPWPVENEFTSSHLLGGLAPVDNLRDVLEYYHAVTRKYLCDLICLDMRFEHIVNPTRCPKGMVFCGFDYGFYESEVNYYSVVFNEVIYGRYLELRQFGRQLNSNLLIPDLGTLKGIESVRIRLVDMGADLEGAEGEEQFAYIAVYRPYIVEYRQ